MAREGIVDAETEVTLDILKSNRNTAAENERNMTKQQRTPI